MYKPKQYSTTETLTLSLLALVGAGIILLLMALGQYAQPFGDDFCMAEGVRQEGLWLHLWQHYLIWSGRYSGNALYAIYPLAFGLLDSYKYIAVLLLSSLVTATAFFLARLFRSRVRSLTVIVAALTFAAVYVLGLRSPASSLYWMAGSMSYMMANILLLVLAGLMLQLIDRQRDGKNTGMTLAALTGVLVLAIGANETGMLMAFAAASIMLLANLLKDRRTSAPWLFLFLVATGCSSIVYFAPGNTVREATYPLRHDLMRSIQGGLGMGWWTLAAWVKNPVLWAATLLTSFLTALLCRRSARQFQPRKRHLAISIGATLLIPFVLEFPAWWAMGAWPPARTVDAIYFVFLCGWLFMVGAITVYFLPAGWREKTPNTVSRAAFVVTVVLFAAAVFTNGKFQHAQMDLRKNAPAFDAYMQQRYSLINEALASGTRNLIVPEFKGEYPRSIYFNDILSRPHDWRNICYAHYFGLDSIQRQRPQRKPHPAWIFPPSPPLPRQ